MKYEPKKCCICGATFIPCKKTQITCASKECKYARHLQKMKEYDLFRYQETQRLNKQKKKAEQERRKKDTIIAIGYADRQKTATLQMVGHVNPEL